MRHLCLLLPLLLVACASRPSLTVLGPGARAPEAASQPASVPAPVDVLKRAVIETGDPELTRTLLALLGEETDGRARRFVEAGAVAWRQGDLVLAERLWLGAIGCEPRQPLELDLGEGQRLALDPLLEVGFGWPDGPSHSERGEAFVAGLAEELRLQPPTLLRAHQGWLLRVGRAEVIRAHRAIDRLLRARGKRPTLTLSVRLIQPREGAELRFERGQVLSADQLRALEQRTTVLSAPRLTIFAGQQGHVSVLDQTSYVADYELRPGGDGVIADPRIEVFQQGVIVGLRGVPLDERSVYLQLYLELRRLIELRQLEVELHGQPVAIEVPELATLREQVRLRLPLGKPVAIPLADAEVPLAIVTVERATPEGK